jgi:hypothetical protein
MSPAAVRAMVDLARAHGLGALIAPVRPAAKSAYPLAPMERYVRWENADGLPLDPWIRVHTRMGAAILRVAPRTLVIEGAVAEWERWTDMRFPDSGSYVVPGALQPVVIDPRGATRQRVGSPSAALTALAADETMVAWLANGCVLAAGVTDVATLEVVPPRPCPRAEVVLDEHDQKVRGGSVRVQVTCVAAPPSGCRGAVVLGFRGRAARGRFRVPAGGRQVVTVRLTRRGRAAVRRQLRLDGAVLFRMRARVADGRVSREAGTRWMLIDARP